MSLLVNPKLVKHLLMNILKTIVFQLIPRIIAHIIDRPGLPILKQQRQQPKQRQEIRINIKHSHLSLNRIILTGIGQIEFQLGLDLAKHVLNLMLLFR